MTESVSVFYINSLVTFLDFIFIYGYLYHILYYIYDVYLSLSDLLHSAQQSLGLSMLLQMALFHSFYTLSSLSIAGCLGCFCILAIVNSTAMSIEVHEIFSNYCFLQIYAQEWDYWIPQQLYFQFSEETPYVLHYTCSRFYSYHDFTGKGMEGQRITLARPKAHSSQWQSPHFQQASRRPLMEYSLSDGVSRPGVYAGIYLNTRFCLRVKAENYLV